MAVQKLSIKLGDGETSKTLTFSYGDSGVTKTQVNAFVDAYNDAYASDTYLQVATWTPAVSSIKLFED